MSKNTFFCSNDRFVEYSVLIWYGKADLMKKRKEFENCFSDYINHPKVGEMKNYSHHGINRYDHSYRVALHTYRITKMFHLNYKSATKAAILHDFFLDEVAAKNAIERLTDHPDIAVYNAKKYFNINEMEEDIIKKHMFPITSSPPKYVEGWIVDFVDDYVSIFERIKSFSSSVKYSFLSNFIFVIVFLKSII